MQKDKMSFSQKTFKDNLSKDNLSYTPQDVCAYYAFHRTLHFCFIIFGVLYEPLWQNALLPFTI